MVDACYTNMREMFDVEDISNDELTEMIAVIRKMNDLNPNDLDLSVKKYAEHEKARLMEAAAEKIRSAIVTEKILKLITEMPDETGVKIPFTNKYILKPVNQLRNKVEAIIGGSALEGKYRRLSIETQQKSHHNLMHAYVKKVVEKYDIDAEVLTSDDFGLKVMKEIYAMAEGKTDSITADPHAFSVAKAARETFDHMRKEFAILGKAVGYVDNYAGHRVYDVGAFAEPGKIDLFKSILMDPNQVDYNRTFTYIPDSKVPARIDEMIDHIVTGNAQDFTKGRTIHFKTAEAEFNFMKEFGAFDNWYHSFMTQVDNASKVAGQMEVLGPRPKEVFEKLAKAAVPNDELREHTRLMHRFNDISGRYAKAIDNNLAKNLSAFRMFVAATKLGSAVVTAFFPDHVAAAALVSSADGRGPLIQFGKSLAAYTKGMSGENLKRVARHMLLQEYDAVANLTQEAVSASGVHGKFSRVVTNIIKWQGLERHSKMNRSGVALSLGHNLSEYAAVGYKELPARLISTFESYGIEEKHWNILRENSTEVIEGIHAITPSAILEKATGNRLMREAGMRYAGMINDYARLSTLDSNSWSRQSLLWGTKEGTWPGEILRSMAQFKQAGLNMMALQRRLYNSMDTGAYITAAAMFTLSGFMSYQAREVLTKGKTFEIPDWDTEEGKRRWLILALESLNRGAGGLLGDTIIAEYDKTYRTLAGDVAGPGIVMAGKYAQYIWSAGWRGDIPENDIEIAKLLKSSIPGNNFVGLSGFVVEPMFDTLYGTLNSRYEPNIRAKLRKRGQKRLPDYLFEKGSF